MDLTAVYSAIFTKAGHAYCKYCTKRGVTKTEAKQRNNIDDVWRGATFPWNRHAVLPLLLKKF